MLADDLKVELVGDFGVSEGEGGVEIDRHLLILCQGGMDQVRAGWGTGFRLARARVLKASWMNLPRYQPSMYL